MTFPIPDHVAIAMRRLEEKGWRAYLVGGCVRDACRGVPPHDYDLTTDARPEETAACFPDCRVIETGLRHGTVTVLIGGDPIEITTFRVDGTYADHRRPDSVTFTPSLEEDLARRDFTVNAMAWGREGLVDPFGGRRDLERKVLACVGEPARRFDEDGLRILRALRFAATLGFSLAPETAAAVHRMRHLLDAISFERKLAELTKLLLGDFADGVLTDYADVMAQMLPELAHTPAPRLAALPAEREVRLAALLAPLGGEGAAAVLARFKCDTATRRRVAATVAHRADPINSRSERLRLVHAIGFPAARDVALLCGNREALADLTAAEEEKAPVSVSQLAVTGEDLAAAGVPRGKPLGATLEALLLRVMDGDLPNEREALLAARPDKRNPTLR